MLLLLLLLLPHIEHAASRLELESVSTTERWHMGYFARSPPQSVKPTVTGWEPLRVMTHTVS